MSSYRPLHFVLSDVRGLSDWQAFAAAEDAVLDASRMQGQWREWMRCADPVAARTWTEAQVNAAFETRQADSETGRYGTVVWYPWRKQALLLLEEAEFAAVRTNRNQLKIRREEQAALSEKAVGIVGLSVGRSMALALAMERIVGTLHIADDDTIELSNLNRMPCSLFELGTEKMVLHRPGHCGDRPLPRSAGVAERVPCRGHGGIHGRIGPRRRCL